MKPQRLSDNMPVNLPKQQTIDLFNKIKPGYFLTLEQAAKELNIAVVGLQKRIINHRELVKFRCYIKKSAATRQAIFVHPKYRAELIKKGIATEKY
jgi:hypothetical protein